MVLADLGADVVKVERPGVGDETRTWGPPFVEGESAYFLAVNRGKRSIELDLSSEPGRAAFMRLAARADVVVENFRAGGAEALEVGYEQVRPVNPRLVYCSITGFGDREPAGRPGYDFVIQAESGLMSITGEPGGAPSKVGVAVVDVLAGLNAAIAILAGLRRRDRTGKGEHVEVSLLDSALSGLVNVAQNVLVTGEEAGRYGNTHRSVAPYQPLRAKGGLVAIAAANDGLFEKLCGALERNDLLGDPRFATNAERVEHRAELAEAARRHPCERPSRRVDRTGQRRRRPRRQDPRRPGGARSRRRRRGARHRNGRPSVDRTARAGSHRAALRVRRNHGACSPTAVGRAHPRGAQGSRPRRRRDRRDRGGRPLGGLRSMMGGAGSNQRPPGCKACAFRGIASLIPP